MTADGTALVLVTVDLADPRTSVLLAATAAVLEARPATVHGAGPPLAEVLTDLAAEPRPPSRTVLLPVPGEEPGTGWSWVRRVGGHWWRTHPAPPFTLELTAPAADAGEPAVRAALAGARQPVTGREAGLTSAAWQDVPAHRHHLLVCRGPRCSAQGAAATARAVGAGLRRRGWGDDEVLVTQTGCLFPCNQAPVVCVHPGGRWVGPVRPGDVAGLLDELDAPPLAGAPEKRRTAP